MPDKVLWFNYRAEKIERTPVPGKHLGKMTRWKTDNNLFTELKQNKNLLKSKNRNKWHAENCRWQEKVEDHDCGCLPDDEDCIIIVILVVNQLALIVMLVIGSPNSRGQRAKVPILFIFRWTSQECSTEFFFFNKGQVLYTSRSLAAWFWLFLQARSPCVVPI